MVWLRIASEGTEVLNFTYEPWFVTRAGTQVPDQETADQMISEAAQFGVVLEPMEPAQ